MHPTHVASLRSVRFTRSRAARTRQTLGVLCIAVAAVLAGCGRRTPLTEVAAKEGTLLVGNAAEPADLDPPTVTAYTDMNVINALFEGLTFIDEASAKAVPAAAESWSVSPDGLTWTFRLRENGKWSNGEPVVGDDFVQSFRRTVSPALALENASYLFVLKNAEAINAGRLTDLAALGAAAPDARTLVLALEKPTPHLPLLTALTPWYPIHPRTLARHEALQRRGTAWTKPGNLVGNGAFQLVEWSPNARIILDRNPHYWGAADTELRHLHFLPIEKPDAEERSFRAGQLHVTFSVPVSKVEAWRSRDPRQLRVDPFLQTTFIEFNTTRAPFDDARVRRAFALAIDREAISRAALRGTYPAAAGAVPPGTGAYTTTAGLTHDPERARALLAEAGHAQGVGLPTLALQVRNDEIQPIVAEALQGMWRRELGVHVEITQLEQKTWLQNQQSLNYTLSTFSWVADFPDPLTFLGLFTSSHGNNWTGWKDPAYDRLIEDATTNLDPARRTALFRNAEALLLEHAPVSPVYHGAQTYLISPAVEGWTAAALGIRRYQRVKLRR